MHTHLPTCFHDIFDIFSDDVIVVVPDKQIHDSRKDNQVFIILNRSQLTSNHQMFIGIDQYMKVFYKIGIWNIVIIFII